MTETIKLTVEVPCSLRRILDVVKNHTGLSQQVIVADAIEIHLKRYVDPDHSAMGILEQTLEHAQHARAMIEAMMIDYDEDGSIRRFAERKLASYERPDRSDEALHRLLN